MFSIYICLSIYVYKNRLKLQRWKHSRSRIVGIVNYMRALEHVHVCFVRADNNNQNKDPHMHARIHAHPTHMLYHQKYALDEWILKHRKFQDRYKI